MRNRPSRLRRAAIGALSLLVLSTGSTVLARPADATDRHGHAHSDERHSEANDPPIPATPKPQKIRPD